MGNYIQSRKQIRNFMINLSNLSFKEKIYLAELVRASPLEVEITPESLHALKPGVLEVALSLVTVRLDKRQTQVIKKIIEKIPVPDLQDGELLAPKENRLN